MRNLTMMMRDLTSDMKKVQAACTALMDAYVAEYSVGDVVDMPSSVSKRKTISEVAYVVGKLLQADGAADSERTVYLVRIQNTQEVVMTDNTELRPCSFTDRALKQIGFDGKKLVLSKKQRLTNRELKQLGLDNNRKAVLQN